MISEISGSQSQGAATQEKAYRHAVPQTPPASSPWDAKWAEGESVRAFMPTQQQTQIVALFVIPLMFGVLYQHVYLPALFVWLVLSVLLAIYRWRLTSHYTRHLKDADSAAQIQFITQNAWTWPATALLWSVLIWLGFSQAPQFNQQVCFVSLASIGVFSATGYAPHFKTLKWFINTLMVSLLAGMLFRYFLDKEAAEASMMYPIFALVLVF